MIITAMYMYGLIQDAWTFNIYYIMLSFVMDIVLCTTLSSNAKFNNIPKTTSSDEKHLIRKQTELVELQRRKLDKELYG